MNRCDEKFENCWSKRTVSNQNLSTENFKCIKKLDKGSFGYIYLVRWFYDNENPEKTSLCVLKITSQEQLIKKRVHLFAIRERNILQCCEHPNIIRLFASFKDESNIYLVLEFLNGGDFFAYIQSRERLNEDETRFYIGQIILAFDYLHCCHIIYRDLKPENLMLTDRGYLKLIDFGFAKRTFQPTLTMCGTPQYMSPEMIQHEKYDKSVDYWALGILTYELLTGQIPFKGRNHEELFDAILKHPIDFPSTIFTKISEDFLENLLKRNPNERLTSIEMIQLHRWFKQSLYSFEQLKQQSIPAVYIPKNLTDYTNSPLKTIAVRTTNISTDKKLFEKF